MCSTNFKVRLKTGEIVEVPFDELEDYLYENEDNIELQKFNRRGKENQATCVELETEVIEMLGDKDRGIANNE